MPVFKQEPATALFYKQSRQPSPEGVAVRYTGTLLSVQKEVPSYIQRSKREQDRRRPPLIPATWKRGKRTRVRHTPKPCRTKTIKHTECYIKQTQEHRPYGAKRGLKQGKIQHIYNFSHEIRTPVLHEINGDRTITETTTDETDTVLKREQQGAERITGSARFSQGDAGTCGTRNGDGVQHGTSSSMQNEGTGQSAEQGTECSTVTASPLALMSGRGLDISAFFRMGTAFPNERF